MCFIALVVGASPAHAVTTYTAFTIDSKPGDPLASGNTYVFTSSNAAITAGPYGGGFDWGVGMNVDAPGHSFGALVTPPGGGFLAPGTYQTARFHTDTLAGLDVSGDGVGCNESTGTLVVHDVGWITDPVIVVTKFSATFTQLCEGGTQPLSGELRYNASEGYAAAIQDPSKLQFADQLVTIPSGQSGVAINNAGTSGLTLGQANITGQDPGDFTVASDTCSGQTVAVGSSCLVKVVFTPTDAGLRRAVLHFNDNTAANGRDIGLSGTGYRLSGSVTIATSASTILGKGSAVVTGTLHTASTNNTLSLYARPEGASWQLLSSGTVDADGDFAVTVQPRRNTDYSARWSGDPTHDSAASAVVTVKVRVIVHASSLGGYDIKRGYRLYHYTSRCGSQHRGCPRFLATTSPSLPGHEYNLLLQARARSGAWRKVLAANGRLGPRGRTTIIILYSNKSVIGHRLRINFKVPSDQQHLGNTSRWVYFVVTR
jgi:hypothetical protein